MSAPTGATDEQIAAAATAFESLFLTYEGPISKTELAERVLAVVVPTGYRIVGSGVTLWVECDECDGSGRHYLTSRDYEPCPKCVRGFVPLERAE